MNLVKKKKQGSKRIFHFHVVKVKVGMSRNSRVTWRILSEGASSFLPQVALQEALDVPFGGVCDHRAWKAVGFLSYSLPDLLCRVSVSVSPAWSPVFSHLASSLRGLWTIRVYKAEQTFQELFNAHQDLHSGL